MMLQLYGDLLSQPSRAVALFCLVNDIAYEFHHVNLPKMEQRSPEFLAINPRGQVPAISDDGFNLAESSTILRYLAVTRSVADHWYPADVKRRARVDALLDWYHGNLRQTAYYVFAKELQEAVFKLPPAKREDIRLYERYMEHSMSTLELELLSEEGPFLLGASEPSIADLLFACEVTQTQVLNKPDFEAVLAPRPKIRTWLQDVESKLAPHFYAVHSTLRETVAYLEKERNLQVQTAL